MNKKTKQAINDIITDVINEKTTPEELREQLEYLAQIAKNN